MGKRMILAASAALALMACRSDEDRWGGREPPRDDSAIGARPGDASGSNETMPSAQSNERSGIYEVTSVGKDQIVLQQRGTSGEVQPQSGRELRVSTMEFQRLAGREAREGEAFHVETDAAGQPMKIEPQSERMQGGSESGSQETKGDGASHGSGTSSGNNDGSDK